MSRVIAAVALALLFASPAQAVDLIMVARQYIGTNPTNRERLWCARFLNFILERSGLRGTGSDAAKSFASYGHRVNGPQPGAIAVMSRGKGGHVGIVTAIPNKKTIIMISGNDGGAVRERARPFKNIIAWRQP